MMYAFVTWPLGSGLRMVVSAVGLAFVAEKYVLGFFSPKCVPIAVLPFGLLVAMSALRQMGKAGVPVFRKIAGVGVAAIVCSFIGVCLWSALEPGDMEVFSRLPVYLTLKSPEVNPIGASPEGGTYASEDKAEEMDEPKDAEPAASAPAPPKPILDLVALEARCDALAQNAPRFARELYGPDEKDEPAWIVEARELDREITRSFEAFKKKVEGKIRTSFATLSDEDKEYVDWLSKNWHLYPRGAPVPYYADFQNRIVQIGPPHFDNGGMDFVVSDMKTRIQNLSKLQARLSMVPGFSF